MTAAVAATVYVRLKEYSQMTDRFNLHRVVTMLTDLYAIQPSNSTQQGSCEQGWNNTAAFLY